MVVIFDDKNVSNVSLHEFFVLLHSNCLQIKAFQGTKRDMSCRMSHDRDSNNNRRHDGSGMNNSLEKSTTSTGSGQRSPLSSASDKSCDEQLLLMQQQQQQQQQQRSMYLQHQQQQGLAGRYSFFLQFIEHICFHVRSIRISGFS